MWLADIKKWRRQEQQVLAILFSLEQALPDYRVQLDKHHYAIDEHEKELEYHRKELSEYQQKDVNDKQFTELMNAHRHEAKRHAKTNQMHADFRLKHLAAMTELSRLSKIILAYEDE